MPNHKTKKRLYGNTTTKGNLNLNNDYRTYSNGHATEASMVTYNHIPTVFGHFVHHMFHILHNDKMQHLMYIKYWTNYGQKEKITCVHLIKINDWNSRKEILITRCGEKSKNYCFSVLGEAFL